MLNKKQIIFPLCRPVPRGDSVTRNCFCGGSCGLTLFEIIIVMAIIGVLASIATPTLMKYRTKAKNALAVSEIRLIEKEIKMYQIENMRLPDRLNEVKLGNISDPWGNSYQYLKIAQEDQVEKENGKGNGSGNGNGNAKGKDSTNDENPLEDEKSKPRKDHFLVPVNSDFDLYSMGEDRKSQAPFTAAASFDDIVRVDDGRYVGLVSEF